MHKIIMTKPAATLLLAALTMTAFCGCKKDAPATTEATLPPSSETSVTESSEETTEPSASESIILKTPDGKTVVDTTYVRTIPGVKPEMMYADYWIKEEHNKVLMTKDQIEEFNKTNRGVIKAKNKTP